MMVMLMTSIDVAVSNPRPGSRARAERADATLVPHLAQDGGVTQQELSMGLNPSPGAGTTRETGRQVSHSSWLEVC